MGSFKTSYGDRLAYDLAYDVEATLIKIQVKYAWFDEPSGNYVVDNRRTKTNRRLMVRVAYKQSDFDFALVYIELILQTAVSKESCLELPVQF